MGMLDIFKKNKGNTLDKDIKQIYLSELSTNLNFKTYGIQLCINKIADALARVDFDTLENGKSVKKENWWLLNIEPNKNQNASEFWNKFVHKLVYDDEGVLIVQLDSGELIIADDFTLYEYVTKDNVYKNVMVERCF